MKKDGFSNATSPKIIPPWRDFDRAFFPCQIRTRDRWLSIDRAYYNDIALPPVELLKIGEMYLSAMDTLERRALAAALERRE